MGVSKRQEIQRGEGPPLAGLPITALPVPAKKGICYACEVSIGKKRLRPKEGPEIRLTLLRADEVWRALTLEDALGGAADKLLE